MTTAEKITKKYTFTDYLSWPESERWELIDGVPYSMTPAPSFKHQSITGAFFAILRNQLVGNACVAVIAPTDVVLSESDIVQPDVFVVCDKKKITEANIQGAPDLIIEVLSPATALKDKREKKALYEKYGVREYIMAYPLEGYVERFILKDNKYGTPELFGAQEKVLLHSLEKIEIPLADIFS
jgi:Uma2 family endonuclease